MLERSITDRILRELRGAGWFAEKLHGSASQRRGLPDICATIMGRSVWIETKQPGKKATTIQNAVMGEIRLAGGYAGVMWSREDAIHMLQYFPFVCRACLRSSEANHGECSLT